MHSHHDDEFGMTPLTVSILNATHRLPDRRWGVQWWPYVIPVMLALLLAMWWSGT